MIVKQQINDVMFKSLNKRRGKQDWHKLIREILSEGEKTIEELQTATGLKKVRLFQLLGELDQEGEIKRRYERLEAKGRGRHYRVAIKLSNHMLTPVEQALMHLQHAVVKPFPTGTAREILNDKEVVEAILGIASLRWDDKKREFTHEKRWKGLDSFVLVAALARVELEWLAVHECGVMSHTQERLGGLFSDNLDSLFDFIRTHRSDPRTFPALAVAKEHKVMKKLVRLLDWLQPFVFKTGGREREGAPSFLTASFLYAQETYLEVLFPSWNGVVSCAPQSRGEKVKGGEKA